MGFSAFPPNFDPATVVTVINEWSRRGDVALFHVSPLWQAMLAGATADSAVRFHMEGIAQIYRGKNLPIFVTIDVTDGLNRAAEAPELVAASRSITEPAVQAFYRHYVGVEDDFRDFPFIRALGLSSYSYFVYREPADIPDDYYMRLLNGRDMPNMLVEGGWTSASVGSVQSDGQKQARYVARQGRAGAVGLALRAA